MGDLTLLDYVSQSVPNFYCKDNLKMVSEKEYLLPVLTSDAVTHRI